MLKGLDHVCKQTLHCLKITYLLPLLSHSSTTVLTNPCCFHAESADTPHLVSFANQGEAHTALNNCATKHVFGDEADFHGGIIPMDPIDVMGLGKGTATGYGNVKLEFTCNQGKHHSKILYNIWYLPSASVRMTSIPQLDEQMEQRMNGEECTLIFSYGYQSVFKWGDATMTVPH